MLVNNWIWFGSYLSIVSTRFESTFCIHSDRLPSKATKNPIKLKWSSNAEQSDRPIIIGNNERININEHRSFKTRIEIITVNTGAELLMISANETGMYHNAVNPKATVKNLNNREKNQIFQFPINHFFCC